MPAALDMGATTVLLRSLAALGLPMQTLVAHLHEQLYASFSEENYVTLFLAHLDPESGDMNYVGAAHEALVVQEDGGIRRLASTGMPIGLWEDLHCDVARVSLQPGELLAICSDGVTEATAEGERFFDEDRYVRLLKENRTLPLPRLRERLFEAVLDFVGPDGTSDDVTLLLLRRSGD
jgi:sigma-B regulation protein RsbU (phosphoserine phosphatase)